MRAVEAVVAVCIVIGCGGQGTQGMSSGSAGSAATGGANAPSTAGVTSVSGSSDAPSAGGSGGTDTQGGAAGEGGSADLPTPLLPQAHFSLAVPRLASTAAGKTALADFDGDDKLDLAVGGANIDILLSHGDGTFADAANYAVVTPAGLSWLEAGDLNGDGLADLAASYVTDPQMLSKRETVVLLNQGDGTFGAAKKVTDGAVLAVADLDGDDTADLIVGDGLEGESLKVLLNDGAGSAFTASGSFVAESGSLQAAAADLNDDQLLDFVVTSFNYEPMKDPEFAGNVDVFLNLGGGSFKKSKTYPLLKGANDVSLADFSGDGVPDILTAESLRVGADTAVNLLVNDGAGAFAAAVQIPIGDSGTPLVVGDFDQDGKPDFAVTAAPQTTPILQVFRNLGGNAFAVSPKHGIAGVSAIASADLNGDGNLDWLTGSSGHLGVLLSYDDGTFPAGPAFSPVIAHPSLLLADVFGDARPDVVVAPVQAPGGIRVFGNDGSFDKWLDYAAPAARQLALIDLDHDRRLDLAVAGSNVSVLFRKGLLFSDPTSYPTRPSANIGTPEVIAADDLNADGEPDLVVLDNADFNDSPPPQDPLSVLLNVGDGTFAAPVTYAVPLGQSTRGSVALVDLNGDAALDIAVAGGKAVSILMNKGDGSFLPAVDYVGGGARSISAADVNGDQKPDLLYVEAGGVRLRLNDGQGKLGAATSAFSAPGVTPNVALLYDVNSDGKQDLVAAGGPYVVVALGRGDATFEPPLVYLDADDASNLRLAAGDLNADGKVDICVQTAKGFSVLFNDGS